MALTSKSFKGKALKNEGVVEERQHFAPCGPDGYPDGMGTQDTMKGLVGAQAMNSPASKGLSDDAQGHVGMPPPPRHNYSVPGATNAPGPANSASTGAAGAVPASVDKTGGKAAASTGAGQGKKVVVKYGQPGVGSPPGGLTQGGPNGPGGNGRNTGK